MLADIVDHVIGIDPDRDQITASLVEASTGGELATAAFETTRGGYERLVAWADRHTSRESRAWAVEGSRSYGSGACAHLGAAGELVIEFSHPRTAATSDGAKTDALDARRAAREVLGRPNLAVPRARGRREALRALESTRRGAQTARTAAINELKALIVSAPVDLRDQLRGLTTAAQVAKCAALRLPAAPLDELTATKQALRSLAPRIKTLTAEAADLQTSIRGLVEAVAPHLLDQPGVGPVTAAQIHIAWSHPGRCATKQHSPASPASPHSKRPRGRTPATASTAAATANSTERSTPSPSPAAATAPTPRPTSPNEPPKAKPPEKPNAASNATSPARSTASSNTPKSTLAKHRSIEFAKGHKFLHDEKSASQKLAQHLENVGRSTVAIIAPPDWSGIPHPRTEAHREHLAPVVEVNTERTTGGGRDATRELIASRRSIDTVVAYNDIVALGCLRGLHDLGVRSPDDIAVVGYDNTPFAEISVPSLTSVGFRADELGGQLVRQLLELIADPTTKPSTTLVEPELFVRESTTLLLPAATRPQDRSPSDSNE